MPRLKPHMLRRNKLEFDSAARLLAKEIMSEQVEYLLLCVIVPELLISNSISNMADQRHVTHKASLLVMDKLISDVIRREVISTAAYARSQQKNYMERMHD